MSVGDHVLNAVTCQNTHGFDKYEFVHLGEVTLSEGKYDLKLEFLDGQVKLDWFFIKKSQ
jgi:hypothetical protein